MAIGPFSASVNGKSSGAPKAAVREQPQPIQQVESIPIDLFTGPTHDPFQAQANPLLQSPQNQSSPLGLSLLSTNPATQDALQTDGIPTLMLPPVNPREMLAEQMKDEFAQIRKKFPFVGKVVDGLAYHQAMLQGTKPTTTIYIAINIETGTIERLETKPEETNPSIIYIANRDINSKHLIEASHGLLNDLQRGAISLEEAQKEIHTLQEEISGIKTERLIQKTDEQHKRVQTLKAQVERLREERKAKLRLSSVSRIAIDSTAASANVNDPREAESLRSLDVQISNLEHEFSAQEVALNGLVNVVAFHIAMVDYISQEKQEDDILYEAGLTFARYGLEKDAHSYFVQAADLAEQIGDKVSALKSQMMAVRHNPDLNTEQRIMAMGSWSRKLSRVQGQISPERYSREFGIRLSEATRVADTDYDDLLNLKAEGISYAARLAAENAGNNPEDETFVAILRVLDEEIATASTTRTTPLQVAHLSMAATAVKEPFILSAEEYSRTGRLEERAEKMNPMLDRARSVEAMYAHHVMLYPNNKKHPLVANAMGLFGAQTHFWSHQRTRHPYDGVISAFGRYDSFYPDSQIKDQTLTMIRAQAPHLFDNDGNLLPMNQHKKVPNAEEVAEEMRQLAISSGSVWEQVGADLAASTALGGSGFVIGAKACSPLGLISPKIPIGCGTAIGAIGFMAGVVGGMAGVDLAYARENEHLSYQAQMAGIELSGLQPGEGNMHVATIMAGLAIAGALAPLGAKGTGHIAKKAATWVARDMGYALYTWPKENIVMGLKLIGALGLAAKGAFGDDVLRVLARAGVDVVDDKLPTIAQRLALALKIGGKPSSKALSSAIKIAFAEAKSLLKGQISQIDGFSDDIAGKLAELLVSDSKGAQYKFKAFIRLLNMAGSGKMKRTGFHRAMIALFGEQSRSTVDDCARAIFRQSANGSDEAISLARSLRDTTIAPNGAAAEIVRTIAGIADDAALTPAHQTLIDDLSQALGRSNFAEVFRLADMLRTSGEEIVQLEKLLSQLTKDKGTARKLLEAMLGGLTKEELEVMAREGARVDPHLLHGLVSEEARQGLYPLIRKFLRHNHSKLATQEFFAALKKIKGADEVFRRICPSLADGGITISSLAADDAVTATRKKAIESIFSADTNIMALVDFLVGRGLPRKDKVVIAPEAKKILFETLLRTHDSAEIPDQLRRTMKDILRPTLQTWYTTGAGEIEDTAARATQRKVGRLLRQAHTLSGSTGESYAHEVMSRLMPSQQAAYGKHFSEILSSMRAEANGRLVSEITAAITYTPERGVLDGVARYVNTAYDYATFSRVADRIWRTRADKAARAVLSKFPEMGSGKNLRLWKKWMLRHGHLASRGMGISGKKGAQASVKELHWALRRIQSAYEAIAYKFGTEELRKVHRLCIPAFMADVAMQSDWDQFELTDPDKWHHLGASEVGVICGMIGGNYLLQELGVGSTWGMDIAASQRYVGAAISKGMGRSEDWFDIQRTGATYYETILGSILTQTSIMYGLNFYEKLPIIGGLATNLPFVGALDGLSMNGTTWRSFFKGSHFKPNYRTPLGFPFTTAASVGVAMLIAHQIKGKNLFNAGAGLTLWRGGIYLQNGLITNQAGFWVNSTLEANNPDAGMTSAMRLLTERTLGLATMTAGLLFADVYEGKGDYKEKQDRLLDEAAAGNSKSSIAAWDNFVRTHVLDLFGLWDRTEVVIREDTLDPTEILEISPAEDREMGLHILEPSFSLVQQQSWYSTNDFEYSKDSKGKAEIAPGYFVRIAEQHPVRLKAMIASFENQLISSNALWRNARWLKSEEAQKRAIYYFSLYAQYYKHLYETEQRAEFEPFARLINEAPSVLTDYWGHVPVPRSEDDIRRRIAKMEDRHTIQCESEELQLDDLFTFLRTAQRKCKKVVESNGHTMENGESLEIRYGQDGFSKPVLVDQNGKVIGTISFPRESYQGDEHGEVDGGIKEAPIGIPEQYDDIDPLEDILPTAVPREDRSLHTGAPNKAGL